MWHPTQDGFHDPFLFKRRLWLLVSGRVRCSSLIKGKNVWFKCATSDEIEGNYYLWYLFNMEKLVLNDKISHTVPHEITQGLMKGTLNDKESLQEIHPATIFFGLFVFIDFPYTHHMKKVREPAVWSLETFKAQI